MIEIHIITSAGVAHIADLVNGRVVIVPPAALVAPVDQLPQRPEPGLVAGSDEGASQ